MWILITGAFISHPATAVAQTLITIGEGTTQNDFFTYPAPYGNSLPGARHQMLILASELQAAGMSEGDISSVAFNVVNASFINYSGFTIAMGMTSVSSMTNAWVPGLTDVWGPQSYGDQQGWNTHTFTTPFTWDGISNLVVQTCFFNNQANFNAQFNQTATAFNSTTVRSTNNNNVCTSNTGTLATFAQRPNMRFEWTSAQVPPVAAFTSSALLTCSGTVQFTDLSTHNPDTWTWDFGDATGDTVQNPSHTYVSDGTYVPVLIVSNAFGSDTVTGTAITINANGPRPIDPSCIPNSTGTIAGFGITSVTIEGNTVNSADALTEGYADRSCQLDTVLAGTLLDISVSTGTVTTHNIRAWVDWDDSGDFTADELVLSANSVLNASSSVAVPGFTVLGTPLRVRVIADYDFSPVPDACTDPQFGQAEDYGLVVMDNLTPPEALFSASTMFSCDGTVQFTDGSLNTPTAWTWDFGDQSPVSNETSPSHTYTASGTFTVTLIVVNAYGSDTLVMNDLVTVDLAAGLIPASCTPNTQSYCCGYGITSVTFAGISTTSADGTEGYMDRSCGNVATVEEGNVYPISIGTGGTNAHDIMIWIDLNNDGTFDQSEQVYSASNAISPSGNVTIPAATAFNVPVRMRITADVVGEVGGPCDAPLYGQTEDYSVIITPNPDPPSASFSANPTSTCNGYVQFTDASTNAPNDWLWDFGDQQTSTEQSPLHQYTTPGTYTVSLTVTNDNGSDNQTITDLITFVEPAYCDTLEMPIFQDVTNNACQGVLSDNGGPNGNYQPGTTAAFTIAPTDAEFVVLTFSQFAWGNNPNRFLAIYDGPDILSPMIGQFNGNGLGQLPNGGVIASSGPSITLVQQQNGGGPPPNAAGFLLTWDCSYTGVAENMAGINNLFPQPADEDLMIALGAPAEPGTFATVQNTLGAEVLHQGLTAGASQHTLDVSSIAPGWYVLTVRSATEQWSRTIAIR